MLSVDSLVGLLAPHLCLSCGGEGSVMCSNCIDLYFQPDVSRCAGCFKLTTEYRTCTKCRTWLPLSRIYTACSYEGFYEKLIKSMKFEYKRQAVEPISTMLNITIGGLSGDILLCPIPTAPSRVRERGFDHAKLISKNLSLKTKLEYKDLLSRNTNIRQLGASRSQRLQQMETEFYCSEKSVQGKIVLIVDDVMTTGATLAGAAKVLKKAGAKQVYGAIFARKV